MGFWRDFGSELWRWWLLFAFGVLSGAMTFVQYLQQHGFSPWLWFGAAAFMQAGTVLAAHSFWKKSQQAQPSRLLSDARHWLEELREEGIGLQHEIPPDAALLVETARIIDWRTRVECALGLIRGEPTKKAFCRQGDQYLRGGLERNSAVWRVNMARPVLGACVQFITQEIAEIEESKIRREWDGERQNPSK